MICSTTRKRQTVLRLIGVLLLLYLVMLAYDGTISRNFQLVKKVIKQNFGGEKTNRDGSLHVNAKNKRKKDNRGRQNENLKRTKQLTKPKSVKNEAKISDRAKSKDQKIDNYKPKANRPEVAPNKDDPKMSEAGKSKNQETLAKKNFKEKQKPGKNHGKKRTQELTNDLKQVLENILKRKFHDEEVKSCNKGYYALKYMDECESWLTCDEINNHTLVNKKRRIAGGIGKVVYRGYLRDGHTIAIVMSRNPKNHDLAERVLEGNRNVAKLQPSPFVVQVIGHCEEGMNSTLITESSDFGKDLRRIKQQKPNGFQKYDDKERLRWLIKIIGGFDLLHHSMALPRVHCDLHTPDEFLSQYLLLEGGHVVMSDLDEIPEVDKEHNSFATCQEETNGIMKAPEFIAPEQRYTKEEYEKGTARKAITEKADIWKIPDIAKMIVNGTKYEKYFSQKLKAIHAKCRNKNPKLRPSARTILIEYLKFYKSISE